MDIEFKTGHVGLSVTDVERSKEFYRSAFNFDVMAESEDSDRRFVFLGHGERIVVTLWEQSEDRFRPQSAGMHHLSFEVANMDQVRKARGRLREEGVQFKHEDIVPHEEGAPSGGIFFTDPDGIRLEIYAPEGAKELEKAGETGSSDGPPCGFF